jgi:hypothetical protein
MGIDWLCGMCEDGWFHLYKCESCGQEELFKSDDPLQCVPNPERDRTARFIMNLRKTLIAVHGEIKQRSGKKLPSGYINDMIREKYPTAWIPRRSHVPIV